MINFLLIALITKSESCSALIRASSLIAPKVYDALFIGIGVVSLMDRFIFVVSSSRAFCLACYFCIRISSSVSIVSSGRKKAVLHLRRLLIVGRIVMSFLIFSSTLSLGLRSVLYKKSAAVFCVPATCMM